LKLAKVDHNPKGKKDNNMVINNGMSEMHLKFQSAKEKMEWYQDIMEC
jgi:hypothetical protein